MAADFGSLSSSSSMGSEMIGSWRGSNLPSEFAERDVNSSYGRGREGGRVALDARKAWKRTLIGYMRGRCQYAVDEGRTKNRLTSIHCASLPVPLDRKAISSCLLPMYPWIPDLIASSESAFKPLSQERRMRVSNTTRTSSSPRSARRPGSFSRTETNEFCRRERREELSTRGLGREARCANRCNYGVEWNNVSGCDRLASKRGARDATYTESHAPPPPGVEVVLESLYEVFYNLEADIDCGRCSWGSCSGAHVCVLRSITARVNRIAIRGICEGHERFHGGSRRCSLRDDRLVG